jgi:DNA-binding SARP family transcriptional activator
VEIRLLGPVEVRSGGQRLEVGPPQRAAVLAALAVDAGRPVPWATLVDRVWGDRPPTHVRSAVHANITMVRRLLAEANGTQGPPVDLTRRGGGYVLGADPDQVDLHLFRRLVAAARSGDVPDQTRSGLLARALGRWDGGQALAGLPGDWPERMRESWDLERLDAAVEWARAELRLGRHAEVIGPLRVLVADYPFAEPLAAALMRVLAVTGRDAEALDCYAAARARLSEHLGVDPGAELREVHEAVLRGGISLQVAAPRPAPGPMPPEQTVPEQAVPERAAPTMLPPETADGTGRADGPVEPDPPMDLKPWSLYALWPPEAFAPGGQPSTVKVTVPPPAPTTAEAPGPGPRMFVNTVRVAPVLYDTQLYDSQGQPFGYPDAPVEWFGSNSHQLGPQSLYLDEVADVRVNRAGCDYNLVLVLRPKDVARVRAFTEIQLGRRIGVVLDGKVVASPPLRMPIDGRISLGPLTEEQLAQLQHAVRALAENNLPTQVYDGGEIAIPLEVHTAEEVTGPCTDHGQLRHEASGRCYQIGHRIITLTRVQELVVGSARSIDQPQLWTIEVVVERDEDYTRWQEAQMAAAGSPLVVIGRGRLLGFPGLMADRLTLYIDGGRWKALDVMTWLQTGK